MTNLLEQAFSEASKLPPQEQDALADWILKELNSERRWQKTLAESQNALTKLADEALAEHSESGASAQSLDAPYHALETQDFDSSHR